MQLEHVAIWAKDIDVLKTFYERYFYARSNTRYVNESKKFSSYFLTFDSGARLEIMQMPTVLEAKGSQDEQYLGYVHLAFSVGSKEKVDELSTQLKAEGYQLLDGPRTTGDGYYESVVLDPEGNRIEITI